MLYGSGATRAKYTPALFSLSEEPELIFPNDKKSLVFESFCKRKQLFEFYGILIKEKSELKIQRECKNQPGTYDIKNLEDGLYAFVIVKSPSTNKMEVRMEKMRDWGSSNHGWMCDYSPVYYAGEIFVRQGSIHSWRNKSGLYRPPSEMAAAFDHLLPEERFMAYSPPQQGQVDDDLNKMFTGLNLTAQINTASSSATIAAVPSITFGK